MYRPSISDLCTFEEWPDSSTNITTEITMNITNDRDYLIMHHIHLISPRNFNANMGTLFCHVMPAPGRSSC